MISKSKQQLSFHNESKHSGIQVSYVKSKEVLDFFGWYDGFIGIEGGRISFVDLCRSLDIEKKTLKKAIKVI